MQIAMQEMLRSKSNHPGKIDPMVGAVLVSKAGKELARAHRGNFAKGDHGEFTLLEKCSAGSKAKGGTIYVTLEPCSDRKPPKRSCSERIVEKGIRRVIVGIPDPNPAIHRQGIQYLLNRGVQVDFFDQDLVDEIQICNKKFIDFFEQKADLTSEQLPGFRGPSHEETRPVRQAGVNDLDKAAISEYLRAHKLKLRIPSKGLWSFFRKASFIAESEKHNMMPTLAGLVLFGCDPATFEPQCKVKVDHYGGKPEDSRLLENVIGDRGQIDISGPLSKVIANLERFFLKHVARVPKLQGSKRVEVPEYPWEVVREVVVNALVHRDYQQGVHVFFQMFKDRIVVASPGHPVEPLTLQIDLPPFSAHGIIRHS